MKYYINTNNISPRITRYIALLMIAEHNMQEILLNLTENSISHGWTPYGIIIEAARHKNIKCNAIYNSQEKYIDTLFEEFNIDSKGFLDFEKESKIRKYNIETKRIQDLVDKLIFKIPAKKRTKAKIEYIKYLFTVEKT